MKKTADGAHQLKEVLSKGKEPHLMNGQQYIDSLNDGRRIIDADGNEVKNIADHPALKNAVKHLSDLYDQQFDPETQDIATYVGDDGNRYSLAWKIPRTIEDLKERRKLLRLSTFHTLGVFGRPNDYGSMKSMGYLLIIDRIREKNPELADNIERFIDFSKEHNLMSTDLVPNVQSDRTVPSNERPGNLRIVEERPDGVVLQGAKPVGSNAVLSHFVTISTGLSPDLGPNEALWIAVPVNADGLKMILRESTVDSDSSFDDHPIDSLEEESGGAGTLDAILNGYTADAAIIPEPTNMRIFPKQQGSKWFRLTVTGRTAHGGTPYLGVSAIDKAMIVNAHMKALEKVRNDRMTDPLYDNIPVPIPINIGKVSGGDWPSSVPDIVTFEGRIGVAPGEVG